MKKCLFILICCLIGYSLIPKVEFAKDHSQVLYAKDGTLLGARIAKDQQWRFPMLDSIPPIYLTALIEYEDQRYWQHPGIDPIAIVRALKSNIKSQRIVSGASTLTMQVCRMSRGKKSRSILQKSIESLMALKLELSLSKNEILQLHASHAPFGGNVVGLETASWRYFGKPLFSISTAEACMLAVLPNAPKLIHPGKNRNKLLEKRNKLIKKLYDKGLINELEYKLAILEDIPKKPEPIPRIAPHLLDYIYKNKLNIKNTTIDPSLQKKCNQIANKKIKLYRQSEIHNIGILVLDTQSGEVLAYVGNSLNTKSEKDVDMIQGLRSSGSVLKPILYAAALDDGLILPKALVADTPVQFGDYRPQNYNRDFWGAIPADLALAKSLNVPAVNLLKAYTIERFIRKLKHLGLTSLPYSADHYGLSLILGGGEVSLWEITGLYATMARTLNNYTEKQSKYFYSDLHAPVIQTNIKKANKEYSYDPISLSAGALYHTFEATKKLQRPNEEGQWDAFSSSQNISWKTGTSFGHRDAWAIGVSPQYTVGVWVGNADGEPRHNLTGVKKAAPVLFDIFNSLEQVTEFTTPHDDLIQKPICRSSGMIASKHCDKIDSTNILNDHGPQICHYHKTVNVNEDLERVHSNCHSIFEIQQISSFTLPASQAHYYRKKHPEYKDFPALAKNCQNVNSNQKIKFIYPLDQNQIFLPRSERDKLEHTIFEAAHMDQTATIHWHLNETFLGTTTEDHIMQIPVQKGHHTLALVDNKGNRSVKKFEIIHN